LWHNGIRVIRGGVIVADVVSIDQLDETTTTKAIKDFIDFYLPYLRKNDLEILSEYKVDYFLADINHFVFENQSFTPEQIREDLLKDRGQDIEHVISVINPEYQPDGNLVAGTWKKWYQAKFNKLSVRD
jgi:hypothetical protein